MIAQDLSVICLASHIVKDNFAIGQYVRQGLERERESSESKWCNIMEILIKQACYLNRFFFILSFSDRLSFALNRNQTLMQ